MKLCLMICCAVIALAGSAEYVPPVAEVREVLNDFILRSDKYEIDEAALRAGFEIGKSSRVNVPSAGFAPLVTVVSNHWREVFRNMNAYGTNFVERVLLENTAWYFDDCAYLGALGMMCANVETGAIDVAELKLLVVNSCYNHNASSALYRHYQDPSVTNIVHVLRQYGIMTNWCDRILSGQELEKYNERLQAGALE